MEKSLRSWCLCFFNCRHAKLSVKQYSFLPSSIDNHSQAEAWYSPSFTKYLLWTARTYFLDSKNSMKSCLPNRFQHIFVSKHLLTPCSSLKGFKASHVWDVSQQWWKGGNKSCLTHELSVSLWFHYYQHVAWFGIFFSPSQWTHLIYFLIASFHAASLYTAFGARL